MAIYKRKKMNAIIKSPTENKWKKIKRLNQFKFLFLFFLNPYVVLIYLKSTSNNGDCFT